MLYTSPLYEAPEVKKYERLGRPAEVVALGCVFSEILTVLAGTTVEAYTDRRRTVPDEGPPTAAFACSLEECYAWLRDLCFKDIGSEPTTYRVEQLRTLADVAIAMLSDDQSLVPMARTVLDGFPGGPCCYQLVENTFEREYIRQADGLTGPMNITSTALASESPLFHVVASLNVPAVLSTAQSVENANTSSRSSTASDTSSEYTVDIEKRLPNEPERTRPAAFHYYASKLSDAENTVMSTYGETEWSMNALRVHFGIPLQRTRRIMRYSPDTYSPYMYTNRQWIVLNPVRRSFRLTMWAILWTLLSAPGVLAVIIIVKISVRRGSKWCCGQCCKGFAEVRELKEKLDEK